MNNTKLTEMLENNPSLKDSLFIRGFLITDKKPNTDVFPFYGNWNVTEKGNYFFLSHKKTSMNVIEKNGIVFFIAGQVYNPFTMEYRDCEVLKHIADAYGTDEFCDRISDITGVFVFGVIDGNSVTFLNDPAGMQSSFYGKVGNDFYITSHSQLIGDVCSLERDKDAQEFIDYKYYGRVLGSYLPADMTPFKEVKRIVPGIKYTYNGSVSHKRFWPVKDLAEAQGEEYEKVIEEAARILKNNMSLIVKKWEKPSLSLTGGIDSNTTFASANGLYDKITAFSYISAEKEVPDAQAAQKIAKTFGVKHTLFNIPDENSKIENFENIKEIIRHNDAYAADKSDNEIRKRIYLGANADFDAEVKSWVSDTIRGYWYYYFGREELPKLSAKLFRNLYKIFIFNRKLAKKADRIFEKYIKDFEYDKIPSAYPPADMHYNDVSGGSWGGVNISEMKYYSDITFIYNNRRFFDLMFRVPLKKRICCEHHLAMKKILNEELYNMNSRVVNLYETKGRAKLLNLIFDINMKLPF